MFCNQCGKQLAENSLFCKYCGAKVESLDDVKQVTRNHDNDLDDHVLFKFSPEFHSGYAVKKLFPIFIFLSIFFSFLISGIRAFLDFTDIFSSKSYENQLPGYGYDPTNGFNDSTPSFFQIENFMIGILISFLLIFILGYNVHKKRYQKAEFLFYRNRLEYIDGFFNFNRKQIYYENIQELSMNQNVFQRKYGIGSIQLTTSGFTYSSNHAHSNGIVVFDIPNIENVYEDLKKIVK